MTDLPKQRWRFELGRQAHECKIYLNDEPWFNVVSLKLDAGVGKATTLTLEVLPHEVEVILQSVDMVVTPSRINPTPELMCYCGHPAQIHEHLADGTYGRCLVTTGTRFPPCGMCGGFGLPYGADASPTTPREEHDELFGAR